MAKPHKVDIREVDGRMKFVPDAITVARGDTVEWTNRMAMEHTVTGDDLAKLPDSGEIAPDGGTYSHVFGSAGTIGYHCEIHRHMKGTVTVT